MKIKDRPSDFRVDELLDESYFRKRGGWRVYRVMKRKLTSLEAAAHLATLAGVPRGDIGLAGLKDRQGVTVQYMSVPGGRQAELDEPELKIVAVGYAAEPLQSSFSNGNAFNIIVREAPPEEFDAVRKRAQFVGQNGVPNYFDEQRFGNLTHGQGWIALDLMRGRPEQALHVLLTQISADDHPRRERFKRELGRAWGDWARCFDIAKRNGEHHSIFEYLRASPADFRGAFRHVATRIRLIHLYAYQSHVWNRAVVGALRRLAPPGSRRTLAINEGRLLFPTAPVELPSAWGGSFRLPGEGLEDVSDDQQHQLLSDVLSGDSVTPPEFRIQDVPGFRFKGEERKIFVYPRNLRIDMLRGAPDTWRLSFELPRGAYATMVLRYLCGNFEGSRAPARARGGYERQGSYRREARPTGGYDRGRDNRSNYGGYRGGDDRGGGRDSRSSYGGYGGGDNRGGGRDSRPSHGGYRGGENRGGGRDSRSSYGGYRGGDNRGGSRDSRSSYGGYQGGDNRGGGRDSRSSYGGYQGGDNRGGGRDSRPSYGGYQGGDNRGGGRDSRPSHGGYPGGDNRGGGRDSRSSYGGYQGGDNRGGGRDSRSSHGGYQGGDNRGGGRDSRSSYGEHRGRDEEARDKANDRGRGQGRGGQRGRDYGQGAGPRRGRGTTGR